MADIPPKSALELQIEQEKAELAAVPKIPIGRFTSGRSVRCHLCGAICREEDLLDFDAHIPNVAPRKACPHCHPNRGN